MKIINTKSLKDSIAEDLTEVVSKLKEEPTLVIIQVGDNPASNSYIKNKEKLGESIGINVKHVKFPEIVADVTLKMFIESMNKLSYVDGIIVQLPLPKHIDERDILEKISFEKDVDGLTMTQMGMAATDDERALLPCTALGVNAILESLTDIEGKDVVIVNRSHLIGAPLRTILTNKNATVTVCHSKTRNLKEKIRNADIVVTGIGRAKYFNEEYFKDGQIIIDCSMNFENGKLCGDVDVEKLKDLDIQIASGPGHTGPMTVLSLMVNTVMANEIRKK